MVPGSIGQLLMQISIHVQYTRHFCVSKFIAILQCSSSNVVGSDAKCDELAVQRPINNRRNFTFPLCSNILIIYLSSLTCYTLWHRDNPAIIKTDQIQNFIKLKLSQSGYEMFLYLSISINFSIHDSWFLSCHRRVWRIVGFVLVLDWSFFM